MRWRICWVEDETHTVRNRKPSLRWQKQAAEAGVKWVKRHRPSHSKIRIGERKWAAGRHFPGRLKAFHLSSRTDRSLRSGVRSAAMNVMRGGILSWNLGFPVKNIYTSVSAGKLQHSVAWSSLFVWGEEWAGELFHVRVFPCHPNVPLPSLSVVRWKNSCDCSKEK